MKLLISYEQLKVLSEGYSEQIMSLRDLAEMTARMGFDLDGVELWFYCFREAYHRRGDEGVIELYKGITGHTLEPISRGKYIYSY